MGAKVGPVGDLVVQGKVQLDVVREPSGWLGADQRPLVSFSVNQSLCYPSSFYVCNYLIGRVEDGDFTREKREICLLRKQRGKESDLIRRNRE